MIDWLMDIPQWVEFGLPLIQILAAVHVYRTGRNWFWIWIVLLFPGLGVLIYLLVEVVPRMGPIEIVNPILALLDWLNPRRVHARLQDALDRSPSVANKQALARWYASQKEFAEARKLLESCLTGVYKDDPELRLELAGLLLKAGEFKAAKPLLELNLAEAPAHEPQKRDSLLARIAEEQGDRKRAIELYERARQSGPITEEARVRLAMLLEAQGDRPRARELYTDVVRRMRTANNKYRREQLEWLMMARKRLKEAS
ncbi:MAG: hypothetical protein JWM80_3640 [Cyanobacteria bacterium RYN_339]|nr:hypothetical protein [Cyanobacteria bacterium RYN_339]